ncbi:fibronectin type III domain-containing protein 7-like [Hoplias malabaricus]|uniref:fibronectin type III domain-containing protein 7-like n=1 Tax=Hoplias malabaricus TaxID=27720 RepID=UPI003461A1DC
MFLQPGEPSTVPYSTSSVASVTSISVDYSCTNNVATVSWSPVTGARSYRAVASGINGTSLTCSSNGTSCPIIGLGCGQPYTVQIVSIADCETTSNISYTFDTVPCPPQNLKLYRECLSNVIIFSWAPTNDASYYIAKSVDTNGVVNECVTQTTSCFFTQTDCGQTYNFTVHSVFSGAWACSAMETLPISVSTGKSQPVSSPSSAPCLPQNVRTSATSCLSDSLITTWDPAPGALSYFVLAQGSRDSVYNCTSQGTSCVMTNVVCGQSLSVWITASNNECTTNILLADVAETIPCAPQDVSLASTCGSYSLTLSWLTSNNAIFYTAKAVLPDSSISSCSTMDNQCEITGLQCGQTYEAFVMSTNFICNSTDSQHIIVKTAPCAPVNVQAVKDCHWNTATVQWQGQQPGGSYVARLVDNEGAVLNCSTSSNICSVPNLRCGHTYNITVRQMDTNCSSLPSTSVLLDSAPCAPQNVSTVLACDTNSLNVSWSPAVTSLSYTAIGVWNGVTVLSCSSQNNSCNMQGLQCGQQYNVTHMNYP